MPDVIALARLIGDHFARWQGSYGRPDGSKCPFVSPGRFGPTQAHSPLFMGRALYRLYEKTKQQAYRDAADRYMVFMMSFPRNPVEPTEDRRRKVFLDELMEEDKADDLDPRVVNNVMSRSWMYGMGLMAHSEFCETNLGETCFDARAESFFDWLKLFKTDRGHAFNIGYPPSNCKDPAITDGAFTDDLRLVGLGLAQYYRLTGRQDVLDEAVRLADYYLRPTREGVATGAFIESIGTWCIGPWPVEIAAEHLPSIRMDKHGWGFTAHGAVKFLTALHTCLPKGHPRLDRMRDRCMRSVKWQFLSCQFDDGAIGMIGQDDKWLGMTAAAILSYAAVKDAGWADERFSRELAPRVEKAKRWLVENISEEMIEAGGYCKVTGLTTPHPPENLAWMLALTVEALLLPDYN